MFPARTRRNACNNKVKTRRCNTNVYLDRDRADGQAVTCQQIEFNDDSIDVSIQYACNLRKKSRQRRCIRGESRARYTHRDVDAFISEFTTRGYQRGNPDSPSSDYRVEGTRV